MYCSYEDLAARVAPETLLALCDEDGDGVADAAVVAAAIADADAEINAWLAPRYAAPFETAPEAVRWISTALALERLYARRRETPGGDFAQLVEEARELLGHLAAGEADLRMADGTAAPGRARSDSTTRGSNRLFDPDGVNRY